MRLLLALTAVAVASAQILPQRPALGATEIVFSYAGDLWRVPRSGGAAIRLTTGPGLETYPFLSPDGNLDVDEPTAFTPDGQQILFRSASRNSS